MRRWRRRCSINAMRRCGPRRRRRTTKARRSTTMSSPASSRRRSPTRRPRGCALTEGLGLTRAETAALFAARFPLRAAPLCLERAPDPIPRHGRRPAARLAVEPLRRSRRTVGLARGDPRPARDGRRSSLAGPRPVQPRRTRPLAGSAISPRCTPATSTTCAGRSSSIAACASSKASASAPRPHCSVCADFASCFGDEDGMSRLATVAREAPAHG